MIVSLVIYCLSGIEQLTSEHDCTEQQTSAQPSDNFQPFDNRRAAYM